MIIWFNEIFKSRFRMIPGTTPVVSGDYGNGYVTAKAEGYFHIYVYSRSQYRGKSTILSHDSEVKKEKRMAMFVDQFKKVAAQKL
jgi:hypothetical protein